MRALPVLLLLALGPGRVRAQHVLDAGPGKPYPTIAAAVAAAPAGATVRVAAGTYREPTLVITRPLVLEGRPGARLLGEGARTIVRIAADDVTIRGFTLAGTGVSQVDERAAILVQDHRRCRIAGNTIDDAQFGIKLERAPGCQVLDNTVRGPGLRQMAAGNGIHAWYSDSVVVRDNTVDGHRDGIYFEFVTAGIVAGNHVTRSARYGLHFMFSHECRYATNTFDANGNGVAVMYSRQVVMEGNTFSRNWGHAAYGLLLKDINASVIRGNRFIGNSTALYLEDAGSNQVSENEFRENGWAVRLLASAQENTFEGNRFEGNAFDVATNSRRSTSTFRGNWWDRYRGYDLDGDGVGDTPHHPVRLFSLVVEQSPATLVVLRSLLVDVLDLTERVLPVLTPETLRDDVPRMHRLPAGLP